LSVIYGASNAGKSFLAMDQDLHIAAGKPWCGREVKQGAVVWIAAEGGTGVYKRVRAAYMQHKLREADPPFYIIPVSIDMFHGFGDTRTVIERIREIEAKEGQKVVKVTIDTLSRVMAGGDENLTVDMGVLIRHADRLRRETGAHVMLIHHTGKDVAKGARGSSKLKADIDTEIEVNGESHTMTVIKQRDLEKGDWWRFKLHRLPVGEDKRGKSVTSCSVEIITATMAEQSDAEAQAAEDSKFLAIMKAETFTAGQAAMWVREEAGEALPEDKTPGGKHEPKLTTTRARLNALVTKGRLTKMEGKRGQADIYGVHTP